MLQLQNLEHQTLETIRQTFNEAFQNYFVPLHLSPEQLSQKLWVEGYAPHLSAGAFANGRPAGLILHGTGMWEEQAAAYNCGTGVVADFRGQHLSKLMYEFILPKLAEAGIRRSVLEVIQENQKALHTYQAAGFKITRELFSFKGSVPAATADPEVVELKRIDWTLAQSFWNWTPSWQHTPQCLQRAAASYKCFAIRQGNSLAAYAMINPMTNRLPSFAVAPQWRRQGLGTRLFRHLQNHFPHLPLTVINVAEGGHDTAQFLQGLGFMPFVKQFEMVLELD